MARVSEESMMGSIRALDPGQSFSRSTRIPLDGNNETPISAAVQKLRNILNQAVGRARAELPDNTYIVETTSGLTHGNNAILCTVAVTRLGEGEEEDDI